MQFVSTRGGAATGIDAALVEGIATDGGLFIPETLPGFTIEAFSDADTVQAVAVKLLQPFFSESVLSGELDRIVAETFRFPIPVTALATGEGQVALLELFHGPTAAFKDVGAGFLGLPPRRLCPRQHSAQALIRRPAG